MRVDEARREIAPGALDDGRARGLLLRGDRGDTIEVGAAVVIIAFGALLLTGYIVTERMVGI